MKKTPARILVEVKHAERQGRRPEAYSLMKSYLAELAKPQGKKRERKKVR